MDATTAPVASAKSMRLSGVAWEGVRPARWRGKRNDDGTPSAGVALRTTSSLREPGKTVSEMSTPGSTSAQVTVAPLTTPALPGRADRREKAADHPVPDARTKAGPEAPDTETDTGPDAL